MDPFPQESDLRDLFGADPALLDPELPWNRNVLNFEAVVGPDTVECVMEPAYQTLTLRWVRRERELVYLDLERVAGIEVDRYRGTRVTDRALRSGHLARTGPHPDPAGGACDLGCRCKGRRDAGVCAKPSSALITPPASAAASPPGIRIAQDRVT